MIASRTSTSLRLAHDYAAVIVLVTRLKSQAVSLPFWSVEAMIAVFAMLPN